MSRFERVIAGIETWLVDLDLERDRTARAIVRRGPAEGFRRHLERLDAERLAVVALLEQLRGLQHHPPLMFGRRPKRRLLKMSLRGADRRTA